eukprot:scaffold9627_cov37-Phaeocystis_antarctica.AAC.1
MSSGGSSSTRAGRDLAASAASCRMPPACISRCSSPHHSATVTPTERKPTRIASPIDMSVFTATWSEPASAGTPCAKAAEPR